MQRAIPIARDPDYQWTDLVAPDRGELEGVVRAMGFPEAAVSDALEPEHLPKLERFDDRTFLILRAYDESCGGDAMTVQAVSNKVVIFLAPGRMVTVHRRPEAYLEELAGRWSRPEHAPAPVQPELLASVIEAAVETFARPLEAAEDRLDEIEERLFAAAGPGVDLGELHGAKRRISAFKRLLWHLETVVQRLPETITGPHAGVHQQLRETVENLYYYADELLEGATNLVAFQVSLASHRTAEVMRVLTIFSVFFLPLTFLVGVYGMNFRYLPELEWRFGYAAIWGVMLLVTGGIFLWFKRRGWLR